jgi:hypothetical protein
MPTDDRNKELAELIELRLAKNLRRIDIATEIQVDEFEVRSLEMFDVTHPVFARYSVAVQSLHERSRDVPTTNVRMTSTLSARLVELKGDKEMPKRTVVINNKPNGPAVPSTPDSKVDVIQAIDSFLTDTTTPIPNMINAMGVNAAWFFNARRGSLTEDEILSNIVKYKPLVDWSQAASTGTGRNMRVRAGAARIVMAAGTSTQTKLPLSVTVSEIKIPVPPPAPVAVAPVAAAPAVTAAVADEDDDFDSGLIGQALRRFMDMTKTSPSHVCDRLKLKGDQLTRIQAGNFSQNKAVDHLKYDTTIRDFVARFVAGRGEEVLAAKLGLSTDAAQKIADKNEIKKEVVAKKEEQPVKKEEPLVKKEEAMPEFTPTKFVRTEIANALTSFMTFKVGLTRAGLVDYLHTSDSNIGLLLTGNLLASASVSLVAKSHEELFKFVKNFLETAMEDLPQTDATRVRGTCAEIFDRQIAAPPAIHTPTVGPAPEPAPVVAAPAPVVAAPAPAPAPAPVAKKKVPMQFIDGDMTVRELMDQVNKGDAMIQLVKYTGPDGSVIFGIQVA